MRTYFTAFTILVAFFNFFIQITNVTSASYFFYVFTIVTSHGSLGASIHTTILKFQCNGSASLCGRFFVDNINRINIIYFLPRHRSDIVARSFRHGRTRQERLPTKIRLYKSRNFFTVANGKLFPFHAVLENRMYFVFFLLLRISWCEV